MAIIHQGILGGLSKRIGNVVGASWKGIPVLRIYQPNVSNPDTTAQRTQRAAFKLVAHYASELLATLIKPLWDRFAIKQSGFNAFIQAQKLVPGPGLQTDLDKMVFAKGKMEASTVSRIDIKATSMEIEGNFTEYGRYGSSTDTLYVVFFDNDKKFVSAISVPSARVGDSLTLEDLDGLPTGEDLTLNARAIWARKDGSIVSNQSNSVLVGALS